MLLPGTQSSTVKLQINDGRGGCFPWHYDNPSKPNKRRVTCLLYLNKDWKQGRAVGVQRCYCCVWYCCCSLIGVDSRPSTTPTHTSTY